MTGRAEAGTIYHLVPSSASIVAKRAVEDYKVRVQAWSGRAVDRA